MKKISFIILLILMVANLYSQSTFNGYEIDTHTVTIFVDNTTQIYKYDNNDFDIILHKANNKFTNMPMDYTDGEEMIGSAAVLPRAFTTKIGDQATYDIMLGYFDKYITEVDGIDKRRNINYHEPLFLTLAVSSTTGKVEEVKFKFSAYDGFE